MEKIKHNCGVAGLYSKTDINIPERLFYLLFSLQHRGQESCGIAYHRNGAHITYKELGMVGPVLSHYLKERHLSRTGIGHVRYSTQGLNSTQNSQPISISCNKGEISLVHNGTISNSRFLRTSLFGEGSIFQSETDSELILHLIARSRQKTFLAALRDSLKSLDGAYNFLMVHNDTLVAVSDPNGFRPLIIGKNDRMVVLASETCALDILQIHERREVKPGEIIVINRDGISSKLLDVKCRPSHCIFELIYFARPDSTIFGHSVHIARERMGEMLARDNLASCDIVISVPDSGNSAAFGYAHASGIQFEMGFTRNPYTGRTFIQPTTYQREFGVRMKLHPIREVIDGKRLVLIDDSLVRGTTAKIIVNLLREAGAKEVHLRFTAPEICHPCFYGIDMPTHAELISHNMTPEEISDHIGADTVEFLQLDSLKQCVSHPENFCYACFSGDYPVRVMDSD